MRLTLLALVAITGIAAAQEAPEAGSPPEQTGDAQATALQAELREQRSTLEALRKDYTDAHPAVQRVLRRISALEAQLDEAETDEPAAE